MSKPNHILVLGAGGVGEVVAKGLLRIPEVERITVADLSLERAQQVVETLGDARATAMQLNAADTHAIANAATDCRILIHAGIPRFNLFVMDACLQAGCHYIDMASDGPVDLPGIITIQKQLTYDEQFRSKNLLAVLGIGSDPGVTNILSRYAYDRMKTCTEILIYDGDNVEIDDHSFAITFSPETSIEECLQPPLSFVNGKFVTGIPLETGIESFVFPDPVGEVIVRSVSHEEVGTLPLFLKDKGLRRCEFKYGLPEEYVGILKVLKTVGLDSDEEIQVGSKTIVPRKVVASLLPQPFELASMMSGYSCVGTLVRGTDEFDQPLEMYLYTLQSHDYSKAEMGANITVFQAGIPAVVATEMILDGTLTDVGAKAPEQFDPMPWIRRLPAWGMPLFIRTTSQQALLAPQDVKQLIG